ncbi:hypothetical protein ACFQH2_06785 [Natronoarchaeum sp. GCM10025703]|uniref:DUF7508 domain-containing protein n=1 Tax=unclassified Natronoarchaeum TaxID=2620183 RepID=UPI003610ABF6
MPLRTQWRDLDREAARAAPNRYGLIEYGTADSDVLAVETGMLKDELKSAVGYRDADAVRWKETQTKEQAESLAAEHRERLDG